MLRLPQVTLSVCRKLSFSSSVRSDGILQSHFRDVTWPQVTMPQAFLDAADKFSDSTALLDGITRRSYTYGELSTAILRTASWYRKQGIGPGKTVSIVAGNSPEFVIALVGASAAGAVVSMVNPLCIQHEMAHCLEVGEPAMVATTPAAHVNVRAALREAGFADASLFNIDLYNSMENTPSIQTALDDDGAATPSDFGGDIHSTCIVPFSSGTTGLQKGVELSHSAYIVNGFQTSHPDVVPLEPGDTEIVFLPLFHAFAAAVQLTPAMLRGATMITLPRFEPHVYYGLTQEFKATHMYMVPPTMIGASRDPILDQYDLSSIRVCVVAAAPLSENVKNDFCARFPHISTQEGYGMTELGPVSHLTPKGCSHSDPGVGMLLANQEARVRRIADDDPDYNSAASDSSSSGSDGDVEPASPWCGPGEPGELMIRGPNIMLGYKSNAQATRDCLSEDGWLSTGDVTVYDEQGYFKIVDRCKELVKYKGFQVAPAELEDVLLSNPDVADAAVIGIPDEEAGELPRAYVRLRADTHRVSEHDIIQFVAERVSGYKKLRGGVEFVAEVPKSATGKILRKLLRRDYSEKYSKS